MAIKHAPLPVTIVAGPPWQPWLHPGPKALWRSYEPSVRAARLVRERRVEAASEHAYKSPLPAVRAR